MWSSTLSISAKSGPFRALLLTVLGPRAIFTIDEPRGAFMCPSSTLTVLANSDMFRGLLLTVLGSRSDFHSCCTPRCAYVSVINTHSFGRFSPVSCTITQRFGDPERFPRLMNPGCVYVSVVNTTVLANSDLFRGLLLTVLGSRSDFHSC